jgi:hypothetical protein
LLFIDLPSLAAQSLENLIARHLDEPPKVKLLGLRTLEVPVSEAHLEKVKSEYFKEKEKAQKRRKDTSNVSEHIQHFKILSIVGVCVGRTIKC